MDEARASLTARLQMLFMATDVEHQQQTERYATLVELAGTHAGSGGDAVPQVDRSQCERKAHAQPTLQASGLDGSRGPG